MDVSIGELARIVGGSNIRVEHVQHPHPESEIRKLRCNAAKAARVLGWKPRISLEDGIGRLKDWLEE
jgi:nucleoside-diphosphate-sugar epimerase